MVLTNFKLIKHIFQFRKMKSMKLYLRTHPFSKIGLTSVVFILFFMILMNITFPNKPIEGYGSFIIAFEFARSVSDIQLVLNGLTLAEIKNTDLGNYFDFGFMLSYSCFLVLMFLKFSKVFQQRRILFGVILVATVLFSDFFENRILLQITSVFTKHENLNLMLPLLEKLNLITCTKWSSLAVLFVLFASRLLRLNFFYKILGVVCLLPTLFGILATNQHPANIGLFTSSIFGAFGVLFLFSFVFKKA